MLPVLLAAFALQVQPDTPADSARRDTTRRRTSVTIGVGSREREPKRVPVTAAHLRTAFRTPAAAVMLGRARVARLSQDSALVSYHATAYQRFSAGLGFARIGRDRLIFRHESATEVRWHRDVGAWIDVKGARSHLPGDSDTAEANVVSGLDVTPVPYYTGFEPLITIGESGVAQATVDERDVVHPIAEGAEAYYTYAVGDSVVFRLPDGRAIHLGELLVRPRESLWNLVVGSFWFDLASGQLVRGAYRLAVPMDIWALVKADEPDDYEEIPALVRPIVSPLRAQITALGMEYGLYGGRFWLPRIRTAEGHAQVSFMRVPFRFEQSFRYASVNALDSLPAIVVAPPPQPPDSLDPARHEAWSDSVRAASRRAVRDSVRQGLRARNADCDSTGHRLVTSRHRKLNLSLATRIPCDIHALARSAALPGSLYDDGEELFGSAELDALKREALSLGVQPPLAFGRIPPALHWGLAYTRFNRVEGLSGGALVEQPLGGGYTATLLGRIGHADLQPNAELGISRSNMVRVVRVRAYHRLVAANDWGNPLSFGSSLSALLFGRDDGFYYRASGAELEWAREDSPLWHYRLFAEQHATAHARQPRSFGRAFGPNIEAPRARWVGAIARFVHTHGLDPRGFRVFTDARLEGAASDSSRAYGRGAADLTFTHGIGGGSAALTASAGTSAGRLPPQRRWYLGGAHTVRGQYADTAASGTAYWFTRLELGGRNRAVRPVLFGDAGWVGAREQWRQPGRLMSGVGAGFSVLDGLVRLDGAYGLHPHRGVRVDLYVEGRF